MSATQFVEMYHPLIPATVLEPASVSLSSVDDHAARGWLLVDPDAPPPAATTPYYTTAAADTRFAKIADLDDPETLTGEALGVAVVPAVEGAPTVSPIGAWNFAQPPTVAGAPIGGGGAVASVNGETGAVILDAADVGAAPAAHTHTASQVSDSTTVGRSVLTAADAAAARTAIGAGTSSLALGTTGTTAKAGNYTPPIADLPGGTLSYVDQNPDGTWPNRRTPRTDVKTIWTKLVAGSADPASATSPAVNGSYANDIVAGL